MKKIILAVFSLVFVTGLMAQNENDALRYSRIYYGGTARFMGMSGAYGAVGADFSTLSQNPAGIGLYHKSEVTFTPGITMGGAKATYLGTSRTDSKEGLAMFDAGGVFVLNMPNSENSPVKSIQLGFGLNRTNDYNNRSTIDGFNTQNSLMTVYENEANSMNVSPDNLSVFTVKPAYDANLLSSSFNAATNRYSYLCDMYDGNVRQTKVTETRGSRSELSIGGGLNINEIVYLGGSLGLPMVDYEETSVYTEKDSQNLNPLFSSLTRKEYLKTTGQGINFKLGVIVRPTSFLRFGAAIHTPTVYSKMHDKWNSSITSVFEGAHPEWSASAASPDGEYDYEIKTPMRIMGSIALIAGKHGMISADYEFIDYTKAHLKASDYDFSTENAAIQEKFKSANNLRLGGEYNYGIMSFRAGIHYYGSPYISSVSANGEMTGFSLGFGIHEKQYFLDLAYVHSSQKQDVYLYNPSISKASLNQNKLDQVAVTLGLRF
jgi:hypothetical protein